MQQNYIDKWTLEELMNLHKESYLSTLNLSYSKLDGGIVYPPITININGTFTSMGGVGTAEGVFIDGTHLHNGMGGIYQSDNYNTEKVTAIYIGYLYNVWGHIITDNLKFLWFLYTEEFKELKKHKEVKLIYISEGNIVFPKNMMELFNLADIDFNQFERVEKITKYSEIIVPDPCFFLKGSYRYYTTEYKAIIARIMSKIKFIEIDKVYLTRTKLHDKRDFGEKRIENAFKKKGYKIISPERLSLKDQLSIYKSAKEIAVTEGSISHNALFMTEGSSLVLLKKANFFNTYQETINDIKHLNVTYIDAHLSCFVDINAPWFGPFFLYCNDHISDFLGCKKEFSVYKYMIYIFKCFRLNNIEKRMQSNEGLYHKMGTEFAKYLSPKQRITQITKKFLHRR